MNKSLNFRKDNRTTEQFKKDIEQRTTKERFLINLFKEIAEKEGYGVVIKDNGIDNTGKLIEKSDCRPDFEVTLVDFLGADTYLYEVKNSPVSSMWTFKVYQLEEYLKYKSHILIFWSTGYIDGHHDRLNKETTRWGVIPTGKIKEMLKNHKAYNEPSFGNKKCIRIYEKDFSKYVLRVGKIT